MRQPDAEEVHGQDPGRAEMMLPGDAALGCQAPPVPRLPPLPCHTPTGTRTTSGSSQRPSARRASTPSPTARSRLTSTPRCSGEGRSWLVGRVPRVRLVVSLAHQIIPGHSTAGPQGCSKSYATQPRPPPPHPATCRSSTNHEHDQPPHLRLVNPKLPEVRAAAVGMPPSWPHVVLAHSPRLSLTAHPPLPHAMPMPSSHGQVVNQPVYDGPEARYCPAGAPHRMVARQTRTRRGWHFSLPATRLLDGLAPTCRAPAPTDPWTGLPSRPAPCPLPCHGRRVRVGGRRGRRQAPADQRPKLPALQGLRHQGPHPKHPLGSARGRRRPLIHRHVMAPSQRCCIECCCAVYWQWAASMPRGGSFVVAAAAIPGAALQPCCHHSLL